MRFNVRVYGLLIHEDAILVTDENRFEMQFTKFPGGGLEFKEGILDCLHREFDEELGIKIKDPQLFYINENYIPSAFCQEDQIISIYYLVRSDEMDKIQINNRMDFHGLDQIFRWIPIRQLNPSDFKFPIDKIVVDKIRAYSFD